MTTKKESDWMKPPTLSYAMDMPALALQIKTELPDVANDASDVACSSLGSAYSEHHTVSKSEREAWSSCADYPGNVIGIAQGSLQEEELDLGKGTIVLEGEDFWVEVDPDYKSDGETEEMLGEKSVSRETEGYIDLTAGELEGTPEEKFELKSEPKGREMEVCFDSTRDKTGVSSDRQGQSSCPAYAWLPSIRGVSADVARNSKIVQQDMPTLPEDQLSLKHSSKSGEILLRHQTILGQELEKKYPCSQCSAELESLDLLKSHMATHQRQLRYLCRICCKNFHDKTTLEQHLRSFHRIKGFMCVECAVWFPQNYMLHTHIGRIHNRTKKSACPTSEKKVATKSTMESIFVKAHRAKVPRSPKPSKTVGRQREPDGADVADGHDYRATFPCSECDTVFSSQACLDTHVAVLHRSSRASVYLRSTMESIFVKAHRAKVPRSPKPSKTVGRQREPDGADVADGHDYRATFPCSECDTVFSSQACLDTHVAVLHRSSIASVYLRRARRTIWKPM